MTGGEGRGTGLVSPVSRVVTIENRRGLHARASAKFCAVAGSFDADVKVTKDDASVSGCSIMGLLTLGAGVGSEILIECSGPQAEDALDTLVKLIADRFGEKE